MRAILRKLLACCLLFCLLLAPARAEMPVPVSDRYEVELDLLNRYLQRNTDDTEGLDIHAVYEEFAANGNIGEFATEFMLYAEVLCFIEDGDFAAARRSVENLQSSASFEAFRAYLQDVEALTAAGRFAIRPLDELEAYVLARECEAQGRYAEAAEHYDYCQKFFDSYDRRSRMQEVLTGTFAWEIHEGYVEITRYSGDGGTVSIPQSIEGDPVTSIGAEAFAGCAGLNAVVIPEGALYIGARAFAGCTALASVTVPNTVSSIEEGAFADCPQLTVSCEKGSAAFRYCMNNGIPASVDGETVAPNPDMASYDWVVHDGCVEITGYHGEGGAIVIPQSLDGLPVTTIGEDAFLGASGLTSVTIPEGVTTIDDYAFLVNDDLATVVFPESLTTIGENAFSGCNALTELTIPGGVTSIGEFAFSDCFALESVTICDGANGIGGFAFCGCASLRSVVVPDSVTNIGGAAFFESPHVVVSCSESSYAYEYCNFERVSVNTGTGVIAAEVLSDYSWEAHGDGVEIVEYLGYDSVVEVPGEIAGLPVTSIGAEAFSDGYGLTSVVIPDGVTNIGESAFSLCDDLTSVTIPDSVTHIGDRAFWGCSSLASVTIPDGVTEIGESAFSGCENLTSIQIPSGMTSISDSVFSECENLTSVQIPDGVTSIGDYAFSRCESLTSVQIPDSVTSIGDSAFGNCVNLTSIHIPEGVTSIGSGAFGDCLGLTSIDIPISVRSIGDYAFSGCLGLTSIVIPEGVTSIGDYAFSGSFYYGDGASALTSASFPDSLTHIGENVFGLSVLEEPNIVVTCSMGSYAYQYCLEEGIPVNVGEFTLSLGDLEDVLGSYTVLQNGVRGQEVEALQTRLAQLGYLNDSIDGIYGANTQRAVYDFQKNNGFDAPSGTATPITQYKLFSEMAISATQPPLAVDSGRGNSLEPQRVGYYFWEMSDSTNLIVSSITQNTDPDASVLACTICYYFADSPNEVANSYTYRKETPMDNILRPEEEDYLYLSVTTYEDQELVGFRLKFAEVLYSDGQVHHDFYGEDMSFYEFMDSFEYWDLVPDKSLSGL